MTCKIGSLSVVITRAFPIVNRTGNRKPIQPVAEFSFNLVDENGLVITTNNGYTLLTDENNQHIVRSMFKQVYDYYAPEHVPDSEAKKPLFACSFYPLEKNRDGSDLTREQIEKNKDILETRYQFFDDLAEMVYEKIREFKSMKKNNRSELPDSNRENKQVMELDTN